MKRIAREQAPKSLPRAVSDWVAEGGIVLASDEAPLRVNDASKSYTSMKSPTRNGTDRPIKART